MRNPKRIIKEIAVIADTKDFKDLQSYYSFLSWPVGELRKIADLIVAKKIYESSQLMRFYTEIKPGGLFLEHWHDCTEICEIKSGQMTDIKSGKTWSTGETAIFPPGEKHIPANKSNELLFLIVDFHKL